MNDYDISSIFSDMETYLIGSMTANLKKHTKQEELNGFSWEMWQSKQLENLGRYRKANSSYLGKQANNIKLQIDELFKKSNAKGIENESIKILDAIKNGFEPDRTLKGIESSFFKVNERKLNSLIQATTADVQKSSSAMLRMANDEYRKTIFRSQVFANTGTMSVNQSIDLATKDFLSNGINCIKYANGNKVNISSWAEMAIKTANKRAYLQGEGTKRAEWGIHTVLISQYGACSPICQPLQGKVYIDDVWSGGTSAEAESSGYGLLSVAIASGLFHPNCKHTMSTYFVGLTKEPSKVDILETNENSNIIATQRYNERQVRKYIRLENGSLDASNKAKYRTKVKEWQLRNDKLVKAHPELHRNYDRERLRAINDSKSVSDEFSDIFDNDGLKIPKFANKKGEVTLKPVIRNTDEEVDRYFKLMKLRTDNEKIATAIKNDMKLMPKRDLDLLKDFKLTINEKTEGPNNYRRHTAFKYIVDSSINLKENAGPGTFAHEYAHFASDRIELYHHKEFLDVLKNAVEGSKLGEISIRGTKYICIESNKFVSPYQGRIYIEARDFNVNFDKIDISELQEYISVGYKTYIIDPDNLYQKDKMLYNYLEREGLVYAKRKN